MRIGLLVAALIAGSAFASTAHAHTQTPVDANGKTHAVTSAVPQAATPISQQEALAKTISLDLKNVSVVDALRAIQQKATVWLVYKVEIFPKTKHVTLASSSITVENALKAVLAGTDAEIQADPSGTIAIVKREASSQKPSQATGTIVGVVIDSAGAKPIVGVSVTIEGTKIGTTTNDRGEFTLRDVPTGAHVVSFRLLGYTSVRQSVTVSSEKAAPVKIVLRATTTTLSEVVTTATGNQRRVEISNDIVKINAEELIESAPIRSVTDLLVAAQVPGMSITPSSGEPGAPPRIRIGGVGSISQNNDPVVIVDGVWIKSSFSDSSIRRQFGGSGNQTLPSRLDAIDPATIESIEIVRGPAASALYGPDAANGVIAITTKRGRAGPARWDFRAFRDWSSPVGSAPLQYYGYGRGRTSTSTVECNLYDISRNWCTQDSLVGINPSDPFLRQEGDAFTQGYSFSVSGGSSHMQYNLSVLMQDEQGVRTLSQVDQVRLRQLSIPVDGQMRHPSFKSDRGVSARMGFTPRTGLDIAVNFDASQTNSRDNRMGVARLPIPIGPRDTISTLYGIISVYQGYNKATLSRGLMSATANWNPRPWWSGNVTFGIDREFVRENHNSRTKYCVNGACSNIEPQKGTANRESSIYTARTQSTFVPNLGWMSRFLSIRPGFTMDLRREVTSQHSLIVPLGTQNPVPRANQNDGPTTALAGIGVNAYIRLFDRLSFDPGIRRDFGSSSSLRNNAKSYPRFGTSWLVSDEPFFPKNPWITSLRLRGALGYAAVQPSLSKIRGEYRVGQGVVNGQVVSVIDFTGAGNTQLEPERSFEIESGFDADLLGDRFTLTVTHANKQNKNNLVNRSLPPSSGVSTERQENIARVVNRNTYVQLDGRLIERPGLIVRGGINFTISDNQVKTLGDGVSPFGDTEQRFVAGYPVNGLWVRPILAINDANQNGLLEQGEMIVGDSAVYVGTNLPRYTAGYRLEVTLLERVNINAFFNYKGKYMQNRTARWDEFRGYWDPTSSLSEQAIARIVSFTGGGSSDRQSISELRFEMGSITFNVPERYLRGFKARSLQVSLQGNNLGLWTQYRGRDPGVNTTPIGEKTTDGVVSIPNPRSYSLQFRLGY